MSTHWALTTGLGMETVTRFTDHANNSDKFRRFIALANPNDHGEKILLTQTGRWTNATARGDWRGGTYRFIKESSFHWERTVNLPTFLERNVEKKKGQYAVLSRGAAIGRSEIAMAVGKVKRPAPWLGPTVQAPAPAKIAVQLGTPVPAFSAPKPDAGSAIGNQVAWLVSAAGTDSGKGRFELLSHYSQISAALQEQRTALDAANSQLQTALSLIMLKEA